MTRRLQLATLAILIGVCLGLGVCRLDRFLTRLETDARRSADATESAAAATTAAAKEVETTVGAARRAFISEGGK